MRRVALRGLVARRTRAILTAIAIVLGVAMVSGTFVLTDTINRAFHTIFASSYARTDAVIKGAQRVQGAAGGTPTVPASLLARVQGLPDVREAKGMVVDLEGDSDQVKLLDRAGSALGSADSGRYGFGIDPDAQRFSPFRLKAGRWATGSGEVVIDAETASRDRLPARGHDPSGRRRTRPPVQGGRSGDVQRRQQPRRSHGRHLHRAHRTAARR